MDLIDLGAYILKFRAQEYRLARSGVFGIERAATREENV
jgi:hypothetical protein